MGYETSDQTDLVFAADLQAQLQHAQDYQSHKDVIRESFTAAETAGQLALATRAMLELPSPELKYRAGQTSLVRNLFRVIEKRHTGNPQVFEPIAAEFQTAAEAQDDQKYSHFPYYCGQASNEITAYTRRDAGIETRMKKFLAIMHDKAASEGQRRQAQREFEQLRQVARTQMHGFMEFSKRDLMDAAFWPNIFHEPISRRHFPVLARLHDRLVNDDTSEQITDALRQTDKQLPALENSVIGALQLVIENPLRDRRALQTVLNLLTDRRRPGKVSIGSLIRIGKTLSEQMNGSDEQFGSCRDVEDFRNAGAALLLVLKKGRTNKEAPEVKARLDHEDSIFCDITEAVAYGISAGIVKEPLRMSFAELISRYPDAKPNQIQEIIDGINRGYRPHVMAAWVFRDKSVKYAGPPPESD